MEYNNNKIFNWSNFYRKLKIINYIKITDYILNNNLINFVNNNYNYLM